MNQFETIQDLIDHLSALPRNVKQSPVLIQKDGPDSEYNTLSGSSFMYVDKEFESGKIDEVWSEDDLIEPDATVEEEKETLGKFKKVLVLWFE